jgi:protocatechuate 3,4-dioxygenase alpha subunit
VNGDGNRPLIPTPGQTVGPFFAIGLPYEGDSRLIAPHDPRAVLLHGCLYDGNGDPVPDGSIEIWQADERGRIPRGPGALERGGDAFAGFGRSATDANGEFRFHTVVPGIAPDAQEKAPFIAVAVFSRGLNHKLHTRIYLPRYADLNAADPLLAGLSDEERATLIAVPESDGSLRYDIRLQGEGETVFLAFNE